MELRLVASDAVSRDTVDVLGELLEEARKGNIIGVALVTMHKQRRYEFALTGGAQRSPTFALGALTVLQQDVAAKISGAQG